MSVVAVAVFVVAYVLIASDRVHKTLVALAGAAIMVALPMINSDDVFYSRATGIDWDVLFLLLGMMIIVSVLRQTGVFEYTAIWAAKRARLPAAHHDPAGAGSPRSLRPCWTTSPRYC